MPNAHAPRPQWKTTALYSAIAALCGNGLFISHAQAVPGCGPIVSANQGQCIADDLNDLVINSGVSITTENGPAVLYPGNLGFDNGEDISGSLTNNGRIISSASGEDSYAVDITTALLGTLTNNGVISAQSNGSSAATAISMQTFKGTVNNYGQIVAASEGGDAIGFYGGSTEGGVLNNYGTIEGRASDGGLGYSLSSFGSAGGNTVNNHATGVLRGRIAFGSDHDSLVNAGLIDLSDSPLRSSVGNFTQTASGTLRILAEGDGVNEFSRLRVDGTATIAGMAFVDVREINTLAAGQTLNNVVTASWLTGNFAQVQDNSALFNFKSLATEGEDGYIDFAIVKGTSAVAAVNANNNPGGLGAAGTLDTIIDRGTANPNMQRLIDALGQLGTEQEVSDAVSQTMPLLAGNSALASNSALTGMNRVIQSRMDANRGMSSGDEFYGDRKLWLKTFGSWADQDDRSGVSGFDANTAGLVLGADATVSEQTRIGVALAYANSNIDSNSNTAPNSADVDMYQVIGYGSHSLDPNTELNFQAGVGQNNTDGKRDVRFLGDTATADYSSLVATAGVGLARTFTLSEKTAFTPSVRTDYTWIKDEGYTEKGSSANLKVDSNTTEQWIVGIDGKLSHAFMPSTRVVANLGLGYDLLNSQSSINAAFAAEPGIGFTTRGLDPSPWRQNAGLGLIHDTASGIEVSLRYDAEHSEGFVSQTASVKARWDF